MFNCRLNGQFLVPNRNNRNQQLCQSKSSLYILGNLAHHICTDAVFTFLELATCDCLYGTKWESIDDKVTATSENKACYGKEQDVEEEDVQYIMDN